ncbi:FAD-dependent oxidoreductase [uncultured Corynebacterium sp.]|uniref:FAD-dependent oxidoreductase n=1 Tax=uncultured Corynebacterium sp. TaxID=159447 RepID=UPI00261E99EC|nr:FAD-dependent oxidoreductase [uncultured Corynebacterium sp.]
MPTKYDLAIIGSGGGAFAAAIRASTLGKSVVMIERGTLGGTCVNTGCVPSKSLIAAAGARHVAVDAATRFPGIATTADPVDMPALIAGKQALVESLRGEKYADVALEQAQLFARLGSQVTLLVRSRQASKEEPEVSKALQEVFADEGIRVVSRAVPTRVSRGTGGEAVVTAALSGGSQEFRADQVLVALGRRPVTDGLNLDAVGVNTGDSGEVVVSDRLQSSNPRVWAAGDVTGHPEFVYVAAHHGTLVAENAFADADRSVDYARLPRVTFTGPAIGAVGMTEKDVLAAGIRCDCRVLPLHHVPRALVNRDTRGFIKIVVNAETNEILGLTAVAKDAGELAAAGVHVLGRTVAEVANAWAPYLTMAEGIRIAAKAFTTDPSLLSCCA